MMDNFERDVETAARSAAKQAANAVESAASKAVQNAASAAPDLASAAARNAAAKMGLNSATTVALDAMSGAGPLPTPAMPPKPRLGRRSVPVGTRNPDPWLSFRYLVDIEGIGVMSFQKVTGFSLSGPGMATGVGGDRPGRMNLPSGHWSWGDLTLSRGMASDSAALWQWIMEYQDGKARVKPRRITVILLDGERQPAITWTFRDAFPKQWKVADSAGLDAGAQSPVIVEAFVFAHQGVDIQFGSGPTYQNVGAPEPPSSDSDQQAKSSESNKGSAADKGKGSPQGQQKDSGTKSTSSDSNGQPKSNGSGQQSAASDSKSGGTDQGAAQPGQGEQAGQSQ